MLRLLLACALLINAGGAGAAVPGSMRLELRAQSGAESCPDAAALVKSVSKRLGYNPFGATHGPTFRVVIEKASSGYRATVKHVDAAGDPIGERILESKSGLCADIVAGIALNLSLASGPKMLRVWGPRPRRPSDPHRMERRGIFVPFFLDISDLEEAPIRLQISAYGHLVMTAGAAPNPSVAAQIGARFQWASFSLELEVRGDPPIPTEVKATSLVISNVMASLATCLRGARFGGCVQVQGGAIIARGPDLDNASTGITPHLAAGVRADWRFYRARGGYLALRADLLVPIFRTTLRVGDEIYWETPPVAGALGLGGGLFF